MYGSRKAPELYDPQVAIPPGSYRFGPANGTLSARTERTGAAAKAGHDLLIEVTAWEATLTVGADGAESSLELDVDATSLRVREGTGGMQALSDDDKANIEQTIDDEVLMRERISFRSTEVQAARDGAELSVRGDLTLLGTTHPLAFEISSGDDGRVRAAAVVKQTDWGMKPYSALFGTLKVVDEVAVDIDAALPGSSESPPPPRPALPPVGMDRGVPKRDELPVLGAWVTVAVLLGAEIALLWIR
jgi:polyisoprenoid-binding protein YceI